MTSGSRSTNPKEPMNPIARWAAWRADRRHEKRLRLWLWHKHHPPGPCRCKERIEKLTPKDAPRRTRG